MTYPDTLSTPAELNPGALSRWDDEGGALAESIPLETHANVPDMTNTELVLLRIRVITLENLLIAMLAEGPDRQLQAAQEMAVCISPRPGFTQHPLTIQAAKRMTDLVNRAVCFRRVEQE